MRALRALAKEYLAKGFSPLWVYGVDQDETDEWFCTCVNPDFHRVDPKTKQPKNSPGKHPPKGGNGAYDAVRSEDEIDAWPVAADQGNLALAFNDTFVCIDIDLPVVAKPLLDRLLDENDGLSAEVTADLTGRLTVGLHLYLQCAPSTPSILVQKGAKAGEHIGEIRANGQYAVIPPSRHISGRLYKWVGKRTLLDDGPTVTSLTAQEYARELLASIGIEVETQRKRTSASSAPKTTSWLKPTLELPFAHENLLLTSAMSKTFPRKDRSSALVNLGGLLIREARTQGVEMTPDLQIAFANVLAGVDQLRADNPSEVKYGDRPEMYWQIIADCLSDEEQRDVEDAVVEEEETAKLAHPPYLMSHGYFVYDSKRQGHAADYKPICNFQPSIVDKREVATGEDRGEDSVIEWLVRLSRGDEGVEIWLKPSEYRNSRTLLESLTMKGMPSHFVLDPTYGFKYFEPGLRTFSGETKPRKVYGYTGRVPGMDAFIVPACPGAITANGFDTGIQYEPTDKQPVLAKYGEGLTPPTTDLTPHVRALFEIREPSVGFFPIVQSFGAALASIGAGANPAAIHLASVSGTYKTSLVGAAISIWGNSFARDTRVITPWTPSTARGLEDDMFKFRDLPFFVDDYRIVDFDKPNRKDIPTQIIQHHANHSVASKSTTTGKRWQGAGESRCLLISTGESGLTDDLGASSRLVEIDASLKPTDSQPQIKKRIQKVWDAASEGYMAQIGWEWLTWCCRTGFNVLEERLGNHKMQFLDALNKGELGEKHGRLSSNLSGLFAIAEVVGEFIEDTYPKFADDFRYMRDIAEISLVGGQITAAEEAQDYTALELFCDWVVTMLDTQQAMITNRLPSDPVTFGGEHGFGQSNIIGWADRDGLYFTRGASYVAMGLHQKTPTPFKWGDLKRQAAARGGAMRSVRLGHRSMTDALFMPVDLVFSGRVGGYFASVGDENGADVLG